MLLSTKMLMNLIVTKRMEVFKMSVIDNTFVITILVGVVGYLVAEVIVKMKKKGVKQ